MSHGIHRRSLLTSRPASLAGALKAACLLLALALVPATALARQEAGAAGTQPEAQRQQAQQPQQVIGQPLVVTGLDRNGALSLDVGRTTVLEATRPVTDVSIGLPEIADVSVLSPTRIMVSGRGSGRTQLILFAEDGSQVIDVQVAADISGLRSELEELFPALELNVGESRGRLVVRGDVPNLETAEQVTQVAAPYGEVLNFLTVAGGQQIMLQVVVAEVSRTASTQLGVNFGVAGQDAFGGSNIGGASPFGIDDDDAVAGVSLGVPDPGAGVTLFGVGQFGDVALAGFISALRENNLARILARPNLVAVSGETASFLAGGEFPIPVTQGGTGEASAVTIEYREFGVRLEFVAVALGDGRIRLQCSPEVSELDFSAAVQFGGFVIPGLSQRRVNTTVELADGQSLAIAGLLNNTITANKSLVPLLGDLPILGTLFRSTRYQRRETELVVFVTPRLVEGINPANVPAAPGEQFDIPTEAELFFLGRLGGPRRGPGREDSVGVTPPLFYGPYGFNRAPEAGGERRQPQ